MLWLLLVALMVAVVHDTAEVVADQLGEYFITKHIIDRVLVSILKNAHNISHTQHMRARSMF